MAGFFPASRLLTLQRFAPACPAAGLSGGLLDDLVPLTPQRFMCALYFQRGEVCGYFQRVCISSEEKPDS